MDVNGAVKLKFVKIQKYFFLRGDRVGGVGLGGLGWM